MGHEIIVEKFWIANDSLLNCSFKTAMTFLSIVWVDNTKAKFLKIADFVLLLFHYKTFLYMHLIMSLAFAMYLYNAVLPPNV